MRVWRDLRGKKSCLGIKMIHVKSESGTIHLSHFLFMVGGNGLGPGSAEILAADISEKVKIAHERREGVLMSYCGPYDIIVNPNGSFYLVPGHLCASTYSFVLPDS